MSSPVKIWRNQQHITRSLGKVGSLLSWTVVHVPPSGLAPFAPYIVGIVEMENGKRLTVQIIDAHADTLAHGDRMKIVLRKSVLPDEDDVIPYGIKAVPAR